VAAVGAALADAAGDDNGDGLSGCLHETTMLNERATTAGDACMMLLPSELLLMWPVLLESMLMMTVVNLLLTTHCE